jgi:peptide/nickel transport system ATP-binding protein
MYAGRVVEYGAATDVLARPMHRYTAGLIASVPSRNRRGGRLRQIPGLPPSVRNLPEGCSFRTRCERADEKCRGVPAMFEADTGAARRHFHRCFHPLAEGTP